MAFWAAFSHSKYSFVRWDWFYAGNRLQDTQHNQVLREQPVGAAGRCDCVVDGAGASIVVLIVVVASTHSHVPRGQKTGKTPPQEGRRRKQMLEMLKVKRTEAERSERES